MTTDRVGLYLHVPFCVRKCNYCDFCSFNMSSVDWRDEYIDRLCEEILSYKGKEIKINSIFFGGGTPSLLTAEEFERIVSTIRSTFCVLPDTEFTVEANPRTLDKQKLSAFVKHGVNRLSIGLQSVHENELKILGRIHNYEEFCDSYNLARQCGIDNINVDLMYGIPEQTMDSFRETLATILALKPEHISLYGLILEEGTLFFEKQGDLNLPCEDLECDMYYLACDMLRDNGYSHYEISNYALPGRECRHNLKYWRSQEYIGVGLSAYSYFDEKRYGNVDDPREYFHKKSVKYDQIESIDYAKSQYEYVMLRLRLAEGFSLIDYKERFGVDFLLGREDIISRLMSAGYINIVDDRIFLTEMGFYISNSIINEFI